MPIAALLPFRLFQPIDGRVGSVTDPGVVPTRQAIAPAGVPTVFQGRTYGVAFGETSGEIWVLHASQLYKLDWLGKLETGHNPAPPGPGVASPRVTGEPALFAVGPAGGCKGST